MPLQFDESSPIYDFGRKAVAFRAMNGRRVVRFRVSSHALGSMMHRKTSSEVEMMEAYRLHSERIHLIAEQKYGQHQFDTDGAVLVIQRDVA